MVKNKLKYIIPIILIITSVVFVATKNANSITILDQNGNEYYKHNNKINYKEYIEDTTKLTIKENGVADSILKDVIKNLKNKYGYSDEKAIREINKKGLVIKSTIDTDIQNVVTESYKNRDTFTTRKKGETIQSSFVIMDYEGKIKALATGNNEDDTINRATSKGLQVGSTIKPISIYTPAIEEDLITYSSLNKDTPNIIYREGKTEEWPENYDNKYEGAVTTTEALQKSKNTVAVNLGKEIGEDKIFDFLKNKLNYNTLIDDPSKDNDKQLSALALGYLNEGISLDKLVSSYTIFGNGGYYKEPTLYTVVETKSGKEILKDESIDNRVISETTSAIMNRLLVNNVNGKYSIVQKAKIEEIEVGGKSGTVGDDLGNITSQLFVGMTPEYVGGIWVGYDDKKPMILNSYSAPTEIWNNIFKQINIKNKQFDNYKDIIAEEDYCEKSGLLRGNNCERVELGYYKPSNTPKVCNICN